jgi:DNA-binding CsgD family transcriptional regulator
VQRCRGLLDADPALLRDAAEAYRRVRRPLQLAQTLEDMAVLLAAGEDRAAARGAYVEATEIYSRLGADWDLRRANARLRAFGVRSRRGSSRRDAPTSGWAALSPAEVRIARLVADGRSNPDIAVELLLSRRTIETHVSHILAKLDARSRVDIARQAAAQPASASSA